MSELLFSPFDALNVVLYLHVLLFLDIFVVFCKLQNMLRAIRRVIRDWYEMRARESSKKPFPFNIMKDPRYNILYYLFYFSCSILKYFIDIPCLLQIRFGL